MSWQVKRAHPLVRHGPAGLPSMPGLVVVANGGEVATSIEKSNIFRKRKQEETTVTNPYKF